MINGVETHGNGHLRELIDNNYENVSIRQHEVLEPVTYSGYSYDPAERYLSSIEDETSYIKFTQLEGKFVNILLTQAETDVPYRVIREALWGPEAALDETREFKHHASHVRTALERVFGEQGDRSLTIGAIADIGYTIGTLRELNKRGYNPETHLIKKSLNTSAAVDPLTLNALEIAAELERRKLNGNGFVSKNDPKLGDFLMGRFQTGLGRLGYQFTSESCSAIDHPEQDIRAYKGFIYDRQQREILKTPAGLEKIRLTSKENFLFNLLFSNAGHVVSYERIEDLSHTAQANPLTKMLLKSHLVHIRRKIGDRKIKITNGQPSFSYINTRPNLGIIFNVPDNLESSITS